MGIVFVPERHRRVDTDTAKSIVRTLRSSSLSAPEAALGHTFPKVVGLFADQDLDEVNRIIDACKLDAAQLCGKESLKYCQGVRAQVIKVVHVEATASSHSDIKELAERAAAYINAGHLVTLDRLVAGIQGGTGHSFDWEIARELSRSGLSFLLAGGLSPDNVAQAVAEVRPWGVDVSSGVETDGVKDHNKIRAFIKNARA